MRRTVLFIVSCLSFIPISWGQNIYVHTTDAATHTYPLIDVGSITFDENVMNLNLITGDTIGWNISTVAYYEYDQWYVSVPEGLVLSETGLTVYPNPSTGRSSISFTMESAKDEVQLSIISLQGKLIDNLYVGGLSRGEHRFDWNADALDHSNGVYVCRLVCENSVFNKLIVLSR